MARATFSDFLRAAHASLGRRSGVSGPAVRGSVEEVSASMLRVVRVMHRYLQDLTTGISDVPAQTRARFIRGRSPACRPGRRCPIRQDS